ncbi:hypothetical protein AgCh_021385 [Apium graveolens]
MADEYPDIPIYESLSDDEADMEENANGNTMPGSGNTEGEGSVQQEKQSREKQPKGSKRKWSKGWDTFDYIKGVDEGLKDIDASVVKIRESIKYIKGSQGRKEKFKECIEHVALEKRKGMRQDVPTRWSSTYLMLDSALYYRRAFVHLQLSDSNYKHGMEEDECDKVEVQHTLNKAVEDINYVARSMAIKMQPKFDKYWSDYSLILAIAVVFDPRYKTQFVEFCYKMLYGDECHQISKIYDTLYALFDLYKDTIPTYTVVCGSQPGTSLQNQGIDVMKEFDALDCDHGTTIEKKINWIVYHNYPLKELTQDVMKLDINADADNDV